MNGLSLVPVMSASQLEDEAKRTNDKQQLQPVIQGLAAHARKRWVMMRDYKRSHIEPQLMRCQRARALEYDPDKLAEIRKQGGSEIYMGIISTKCRTATAWLRDSLLGTGSDKPWSLDPTPIPDLPPELMQQLQQSLGEQLFAQYQQGMPPPDEAMLRQIASDMKDTAMRQLHDESRKRVDRMEKKIEDQMTEGGLIRALHQFIDDVVTFPFAVLKGPVPRKRKTLEWTNGMLAPVEKIRDEWERVDPFKFYWAPWGDDAHRIPCCERHELTREDLEAMVGVEGYSEEALRSVLSDFGTGGRWLQDEATTLDTVTDRITSESTSDIVDAVQLWDSVPGSMLIEWGMAEADVTDAQKSYPCEIWLIKDTVIKAVLNYDPLSRKPYFVTSYEKVPGRINGNGVADLAFDAQNMCNAACRALSNNMGLSSGPQVGVNISRLPVGEDITDLYPWKIWQFVASDYNDGSPPITFFQPNSNAQELMAVFERFMSMADEVTGIPRYMTGEHVPGAGRTSSGLSMLISNAGKSIKQVISNIDQDVIVPLLERQYQRNLRYSQDPDMIGDVQIVAKGAMSLVVKEAEAVRSMEFLRLVLESPIAQQIVGLPGTAELMRMLASNLNSNVDRVVPTREDVEKMMAQQQAIQAQMMQEAPQQGGDMTKPKQLQADGTQQGGRESNFTSSRPNGA